jgi:hypothetical protein
LGRARREKIWRDFPSPWLLALWIRAPISHATAPINPAMARATSATGSLSSSTASKNKFNPDTTKIVTPKTKPRVMSFLLERLRAIHHSCVMMEKEYIFLNLCQTPFVIAKKIFNNQL